MSGGDRIRFRFSKLGKIRWISHRDVARIWERALRRADVPVAYSEGFSPRPKVSFGLALPTGAESMAEYLDVVVAGSERPEVAALSERLSAALPTGMVCDAAVLLSPPYVSLQEAVTSCAWSVALPLPAERAGEAVARVLGAESLPFTRIRKGVAAPADLRPAVIDLRVEPGEGTTCVLVAELATQPRAVKPVEALAVLWPTFGDEVVGWPLRRLEQWIQCPDARVEPLGLNSPEAPLAQERAS